MIEAAPLSRINQLLLCICLLLLISSNSLSEVSATEGSSDLLRQAEAMTKAGQFDGAVSLLNRVISSIEANVSAAKKAGKKPDVDHYPYLQRASVLNILGKRDKALDDLNNVLSIKPDLSSALLQRGRLLLKRGDPVGARRDLQLAQSKSGQPVNDLNIVDRLSHLLSQVNALTATGHDYAFLVTVIDDALDLASDSTKLLLARANAHRQGGEWAVVISDTGRLLKLDKNDQDALTLRGLAYFMLGDIEMAMRHFREALKLDQENPGTRKLYNPVRDFEKRLRNTLKHSKSNYKSALSELDHAIKILAKMTKDNTIPHHRFLESVVYTLKCKYLQKQKDSTNALKACDHAIELDADRSLLPYMLRGEILLASELYDDALRVFQEAAKKKQERSPGGPSSSDGDGTLILDALEMTKDPTNEEIEEAMRRTQAELKRSKTKDYYKILGVAKDADDRIIKKAYRKLALLHHPDKQKTEDETERKAAEAKFRTIAEAYEVLSDTELRRRYDSGEDLQDQQNGFQERYNQGGFPGFNFPGGGFPGGGGGGGFHFHFG